VRHRCSYQIKECHSLLVILGTLELAAWGLLRHPQLVQREPSALAATIRAGELSRQPKNLVNWTAQKQPFLFWQSYRPGLVCSSNQGGP